MVSLKNIFHTSHLGGKKNPYSNPAKPNPNDNTATSPHAQNFPRPPAASRTQGSGDLLAEARETVGRDPVTGQFRDSSRGRPANKDATRSTRQDGTGSGGEDELSCYQSRSHGSRAPSGTRYDMFVQEMRERKEREKNLKTPVQGFYAPPPKPLVEYYAPGGGSA